MKTIKTTIILFLGVILFSNSAFAHFGSKGPYGGSVSCGIVNDTIVYLGTVNGGVFFSTKQSLTGWSPKPVGLKSGKITALAHTGSYLFAATADSGIFRWTGFIGSDRYWQKVNIGLGNLKIKSLVAIDSITLLAGTDGGGVFKTTNKGATWTAANTNLSSTSIITGMTKAGSRIIITSFTGGVFASDDKGSTWFDFNDVHTLNISATAALSYNSISDELMIVNGTGLFTIGSASTVSSYTYTPSQTALPASTNVRSISNNGTNWYLATDKGVYTSVTGTISWASANVNLTTLDVNAVVPVAFSSSRLVVGTNKEGIFKSPASTISWTLNNSTGFNNFATYAMATSGPLAVIAATEKGVFRSKDLAATYQKANTGLTDSLNVTDLTFVGSKLFASTKNAGVFISADSGKSWSTFNTGLTETYIKKTIETGNTLYVFSSTNKIYQSNGSSWTLIQTGLPAGITLSSLTSYGNTLLLGSLGTGVFVKNKSTGTWTASNTSLTNLNVTSVTANGKKIYAGTNGNGVFISDTLSISWTNVSTPSINHTIIMNLDGSKVQAMASYGSFVLASYKGGLLATTDHGATWIAAGNQFNLPSYTNVNKISFVTTRVFVTTDNNCLYSNAISEFPLFAKADVTNESTSGVCNGSANVMASGGTAPYTYAWSNGSTTSSVSNLCAQMYTVIVSDASTKKDTLTVTVSTATGIDYLIENSGSIIIFPNPSNGNFIIDLKNIKLGSKEIIIYDNIGLIVKHIANSNNLYETINENCPAGIYVVKINTDEEVYIKKVIIQ